MKNENWIQKEKRELFCKSVNSLLMSDYYAHKNNNEVKIVDDQLNVLEVAKKTVDKAFELYPHIDEEEEVSPDIPIKEGSK